MRNALLFSFFVAFAGIPAFAAGGSIGVATSLSAYSINSVPGLGASALQNGALLTTTTSPSDVQLENGARIRLATRSSGAVYSDRLVLQSGAARISNFANYPVQSGDLQIIAASAETQAIVRMSARTVEVASLGGAVNVSDGGVGMTRVASGTKLTFRAANSDKNARANQQNPDRPPPEPEDKHTLLWTLAVVSAAAIVVGSIAAAQGKSPF